MLCGTAFEKLIFSTSISSEAFLSQKWSVKKVDNAHFSEKNPKDNFQNNSRELLPSEDHLVIFSEI